MRWMTLLAASFALFLAGANVSAHDGETHKDEGGSTSGLGIPTPERVTPKPGEEEKARQYFTNLPVVDSRGRELRFFDDVLKDRVVLIHLFYTSCTGACPLTTQQVAGVQDFLGDDLGKGIFLISISIDPEVDTPEVVRDYAEKFAPRDGWIFLSGTPENVKQITRRLGQTSKDVAQHITQYLIGNVKIARWAKLPPNQPPQTIAERLRLMRSYTAASN